MQSMTGFGKATCELSGKIISIEIKSLNSKQLDIYTRLPNLYREKDLELRNLLSQQLLRGKVELTISYENTDISGTSKINVPVVKQYYQQLSALARELDSREEALLQTILRLPDALKMDKEEIDESEWESVLSQTREALNRINDFRSQEGAALEKDILERVSQIMILLKDIEPFEKERTENMRTRLRNNLEESIDKDTLDTNRFEQELIYYLEKMDITEEKVRLSNHCNFFREVVSESQAVGKKLAFIAQEMGREINTIGSKANHSDIQRLVVTMKDELEKIKEQLMNVL